MLPATFLVTSRVPELSVTTKGALVARQTSVWVCFLAAKPRLRAKRPSGPSGDPHAHGHRCGWVGLSDPRLLHTHDQRALPAQVLLRKRPRCAYSTCGCVDRVWYAQPLTGGPPRPSTCSDFACAQLGVYALTRVLERAASHFARGHALVVG